jgi:hypothetical protein
MTELKKINIGCGYDKRAGFLNVDMDPNCEPDLLITDNNFSVLPRKHFETLVSMDVLEHIPRAETGNALLEWADLLALGGIVELETSNVIAIAEMMKSIRSFERHSVYTIFMYGNQVHPGDFHYTGFTEITLRVHLAAAGFETLELIERDTWLFAVKARKILDWTELLGRLGLSDQEFVREAYLQALHREPESLYVPGDIQSASTDRRAFLKHLYGSEERRLRTAQQLGF